MTKTLGFALLALSLLLGAAAPRLHAQTDSNADQKAIRADAKKGEDSGSTDSASGQVRVKKVGDVSVYLLNSVAQTELARFKDLKVEVRGIIGTHVPGKKERYTFSMDDGSKVLIIGQFPKMGGTTWNVRATVGQDGDKYALIELKKWPYGKPEPGAEEAASGTTETEAGPERWLLYAGGGLIVAALLIFAAMVLRNRNPVDPDETVEEPVPSPYPAHPNPAIPVPNGAFGGPGGTVVAGAGRAGSPQRGVTIESIGTIRVLDGPHSGEKYPLQPGVTNIGRNKQGGHSIVLDKDGQVSGEHGILFISPEGKLTFTDNSRNGSVVDGKMVHRSQCDVRSGAKIEVGGTTLEVIVRNPDLMAPASPVLPDAPAVGVNVGGPVPVGRKAETTEIPSPVATRARETVAGFGAEMEVTQGPELGRHLPLSKPVTTLGRENVDILFTDETISRRHAVVKMEGGKFRLIDEGSSHGSRVNGEPVGGAGRELSNGDEIVLGKGITKLVFHQIGGG